MLFVVVVGLLVVFVALLVKEDKEIKSNGSCFGAAGLLGCIVLLNPELFIEFPKPLDDCIPNPEDWGCIILPNPIVGCMVEPKPLEDCGCIVEPKPLEACGFIGDPKPPEDWGCIGEAWKANGIPVAGFIVVALPNWAKLLFVLAGLEDELEVLYKDKILFLKSFLFCWLELFETLAAAATLVVALFWLLFDEEVGGATKSWNKKMSLLLEALLLLLLLLDGFFELPEVEKIPWTSSVLTNGLADCLVELVVTLPLSPFLFFFLFFLILFYL